MDDRQAPAVLNRHRSPNYLDVAASRITAATASGWDTMTTWLAETSVVFALIAFAMARWASGAIIPSLSATTYQLGFVS